MMKRGSRARSTLVTLLMLLPGLAGFFGLFFYPMMITVVRSMRPEGETVGWTLEHYAQFPRVVPGLIGALGLLLLFGSRGWVNLLLLQLLPGLEEPVAINYTIPGLILFYTWLYFPFTAVTTLSTLESLDPAIEEAAGVSGANRWQVLRHVVIPLIMPGILAGSVLTFMAAFGAFSIPLIAGGNHRPLSVEIYRQINFTPARWSAASARAMIMAALQVAFLTIYMRILRRPSV
jgi:putative spermidine/putrescine transport system permease protein